MKKHLLLLCLFASTISYLTAQTTIHLTFTAEVNGSHQPLDSVRIANLTQGGDTTLYGTDTVLVLDHGVGIDDNVNGGGSCMFLHPAYPNPVTHNSTIRLWIPQDGTVTVRLFDLPGRELATYSRSLGTGEHSFTFTPGKVTYYLLVVEAADQRHVQKLINLSSGEGSCHISYTNYQPAPSGMRKGKSSFPWVPGDDLRFVGFSSLGVDTINDDPVQSALYTFQYVFSTYPPIITTDTVHQITSTSALTGGNVLQDGGAPVLARGVCWSTTPLPTVANNTTSNGTGTGSFTSSITGLNPSTTYYVRAYATNSAGTGYGNEYTFATVTPATVPVLTTTAVSSITSTTANSGGNITSDGGATVTARGVCWSTTTNPVATGNHTTDGTGTGTFASNLTGLSPGTTYYVRAYATNSVGTAYGYEVFFTTATSTSSFPPGTVHCNPSNPTAIVDVTNPTTGKIWMDRNLGAAQVATSSTDALAYGDLYQWGRFADGHQCRTSTTSTTLSSSDVPGHGNFIVAPSSPWDWRSPQNVNLWQGVNGVNNPCPTGYRLPTDPELNAERLSWSSNNTAGAFASPLKLPMAGGRGYSYGSLYSVGSGGRYWSSTVSGTGSRGLYFYSTLAAMIYFNRAYGYSVRCIKD